MRRSHFFVQACFRVVAAPRRLGVSERCHGTKSRIAVLRAERARRRFACHNKQAREAALPEVPSRRDENCRAVHAARIRNQPAGAQRPAGFSFGAILYVATGSNRHAYGSAYGAAADDLLHTHRMLGSPNLHSTYNDRPALTRACHSNESGRINFRPTSIFLHPPVYAGCGWSRPYCCNVRGWFSCLPSSSSRTPCRFFLSGAP